MKKSCLKDFRSDSAEFVVLHAKWRIQRGHAPSLSFLWERNPRKALALAEKIAYFTLNGKYLQGISLAKYICCKCGASNVKLWRPYQSSNIELHCAKCAGKDQKKDIGSIDAEGRIEGTLGDKTDQIGWYVPAVPTEETTEETAVYWGYNSVPGPGVEWWKALPNS